MKVLVIGGTKSGKSKFAEELLVNFLEPRYYIATMRPADKNAAERIQKHREMRQNKGFITIERFTNIGNADINPISAVLLECVSNLLANEMFETGGNYRERVIHGVTKLSNKCENIIIVTNEFEYAEIDYDEQTRVYIKAQSQINDALSQICGEVYKAADFGAVRLK
jgi:adenosylcobinamide kinase/adenosylcobinamide-phosphate guanylyltransferase